MKNQNKINKNIKISMTTSKLILLLSAIVTLTVTIFAMIIIGETKDTTALVTLIGSVYSVMTAGTAFYYWKAKEENRIKLSKGNNIPIDKIKS